MRPGSKPIQPALSFLVLPLEPAEHGGKIQNANWHFSNVANVDPSVSLAEVFRQLTWTKYLRSNYCPIKARGLCLVLYKNGSENFDFLKNAQIIILL